jgi:dTDP-4-amino-4,6-dideoxygalactose transaminase
MILQNDFKRQRKFVEEQVLNAVRRVGASGGYVLGKEVEAFEAALRNSGAYRMRWEPATVWMRSR